MASKTGLTNSLEREIALWLGHRFYMVTKPCRNGHVSKRYTVGGGCYECAQMRYTERAPLLSEAQQSIPTSVYVIEAGEFIKVGIAEDVESRLQVLRTHCPLPARIVFSTEPMPRPEAKRIEAWCEFKLADKAVHGEWFKCSAALAIDAIGLMPSIEVEANEPVQLQLVVSQ